MTNNSIKEPRLRDTLRDDINTEGHYLTFRKEIKDIRKFYITSEKDKKLQQMGIIKKLWLTLWWIIKAMILKLTPLRRLILICGIILTFAGIVNKDSSNESEVRILGIGGLGMIISVLMLELKDKIKAKDELFAGREIQKALMPSSNPNIAGWDIWIYSKPAKEICGDLIDHYSLTNNSSCVIIADVSGKGLNAALFTTKLQSSIRTISYEHKDIKKICNLVNKIFYNERLKNIFATLIMAEINPDTDTISYINAGHIPPIILSDGKINELQKGDPALGLLKECDFSKKYIQINKGEYLIFYSDGVTDAMNYSGDFFEKSRFFDLLKNSNDVPSSEVGYKLINGIEDFIQKTNPADDLSLVIIRKI